MAALPVHQVPATVLHSDAYCMTADADADDKDATSGRFLEYALGTKGQQIAAGTGRTVGSCERWPSPTCSSTRRPRPPTRRSSWDNIPLLHAVYHIATWPRIEDVTDGFFEEAYSEPGGGEAPELVVEITQQTKDLLADADQAGPRSNLRNREQVSACGSSPRR